MSLSTVLENHISRSLLFGARNRYAGVDSICILNSSCRKYWIEIFIFLILSLVFLQEEVDGLSLVGIGLLFSSPQNECTKGYLDSALKGVEQISSSIDLDKVPSVHPTPPI